MVVVPSSKWKPNTGVWREPTGIGSEPCWVRIVASSVPETRRRRGSLVVFGVLGASPARDFPRHLGTRGDRLGTFAV